MTRSIRRRRPAEREARRQGRGSQGRLGGIDPCARSTGHERPGKKVVVVGGGNVAMDARAGCPSRRGGHRCHRRKRGTAPADPAEVAEAKEEGVKFSSVQASSVEIKGARGKVKSLVYEKGEIEATPSSPPSVSASIWAGWISVRSRSTRRAASRRTRSPIRPRRATSSSAATR